MSSIALERAIDLPWSPQQDEQKRFRSITLIVLLITAIFGVIMPFLPVAEVERAKTVELPPRFAKLILEKKTPPPPPPPKVEKKKPEPKKEEAKKPEPKKKPVEKKPVVKPRDPDAARKKAEQSGLLAFKDDLADLRQNLSQDLLQNSTLEKGGTEAKQTTRSMITSSAKSGSGGINTARLSQNTGGSNLAGRTVTQVSSNLKSASAGSVSHKGSSGKASRSIEELQLVFDKNKGAIYSLYNRALRKDPTLQGKVVLELTIAPSGKVTKCKLLSSELNSPALEKKLTARVMLFNFGAKDVDTMVTTYPIEFLPS